MASDINEKDVNFMNAKNSMEDFEALLKESFEIDTPEEGTVVKGKVIAIESGQAIIDVGYKMEGTSISKNSPTPVSSPISMWATS